MSLADSDLNPDIPLGFVTMADAFFEAVLLRMRRQ